jgi:hypothetical protein
MEKKPIPPIIEAADTPKSSCRRGNHREHPRLKREGFSPQTLLLQASPSRQRSEVAQHNSRGLRHTKFQWQIHLQQENRMSLLLSSNKKPVSQFGLQL